MNHVANDQAIQDRMDEMDNEKVKTVTVTVTRVETVEIEVFPFMKSKSDNSFYRLNENGRVDVIKLYPSIGAFNYDSDVKLQDDVVEVSAKEWGNAVEIINNFLNK
jgi:hypothetical protein